MGCKGKKIFADVWKWILNKCNDKRVSETLINNMNLIGLYS